MSLQSPETQEIKYKKRTIATFGFPSTPFCPKSSQNPTDDASPYQVLSIKDDALKRAKETISLAQAKDAVPGPNCMLKSL